MTNGYRPSGHDAAQSDEPVLRYTAFQRSIGHAFVGSLLGAVLGSMFLRFVIPPDELLQYLVRFELDLSGLNPTWLYAALGAVLGVIVEVPRGLAGDAVRLRRIEKLRAAAPGAGIRSGTTSAQGLDEKLKQAYSGRLQSVHNAAQIDTQGVSLAVADVTRTTGTDNDTVHETVAYYEPKSLLLPTFTLQPEGRLVGLVARIAGIPDVDFPSHPAFSSAYLLSGAIEEDLRVLFNDRVLAELGGSPGFQIESVGNGLALFMPGELLAGEELRGFIATAARIFRLFEESARAAGFTTARAPRKRDVKVTVEKMQGLIGSEMRRTLVTRADAEAFARQRPPRRVPKAIALYKERFAPQIMYLIGVMFAGGGTVFALGFGGQAIASGKGLWNGDWLGAAVGLLLVAIGVPVLFYSGRARYRIARVLRHGTMATARIEKVEATGTSINNAEIALLTVLYRHEGREVRASCKIVGPGKERAEKLAAGRKPAAILQDPADSQRIVFVDDLISVGTELEP